MQTDIVSLPTAAHDLAAQLDLEVAEVYVSFLIRRAVKDKSLLDERDLRVQDAVDTWNRGIAEEPDKHQHSSNNKRARFQENGAAPAGESEAEEAGRSQPGDDIATAELNANSKIKNRQINTDAKHSHSSLGKPVAELLADNHPSEVDGRLELLKRPRLGPKPSPPQHPEHSIKRAAEGQPDQHSSRSRRLPADERSNERDASGEGEEEAASESSGRGKPLPWSYMNSYSGYSLKDHPYIEKKKRKLQKQLEQVRRSRDEAQKRTGFFQPFEFEEALKQQSRQEDLFATSIANVDKKLEEFQQKKKARELLDRDVSIPPSLQLRPKKDLVVPQKETADWVRELARDQRLREERKRLREEKRLKQLMDEEQARQRQKAEEARQKKQVRLARVQGHLEEMAQKREVFQQVTRYQNKIVKDLIARPQVFYYVRPSEEAIQRVRQKLLPTRLRLADAQEERLGSHHSDFQELGAPADYLT